MKLFDSELSVMRVLWQHGDLPATAIVGILSEQTGWNKNTTYTVIKKCVAKGAIQRSEPGFQCHALVTMEEIQAEEARSLTDRLFDGAADKLFAVLVSNDRLSKKELDNLKKMIDEMG